MKVGGEWIGHRISEYIQCWFDAEKPYFSPSNEHG